MGRLRSLLPCLAAGLLLGCASLRPVGEFAQAGARLCADRTTLEHFAGTSDRELPYLTETQAEEARKLGLQRKQVALAMGTVHDSAAAYLEMVARMAGEGAFSVKDGMGSAVKGLQAADGLGLEPGEVKALASLGGLVERWGTQGLQQHGVRRLLQDGDAPFQATVAALRRLVAIQQKTLLQEQRLVSGFLETETAFLDPGKDRLLKGLAQVHRQDRERDFQRAGRALEELDRGLTRLAEGHRRLAAEVGRFQGRAVLEALPQLSRDLQEARLSIRALRA